MPGIVGIISRNPAAENARLVEAMTAIMRHEDFYRTGTFAAPELGVNAGWIALADTFADQQVFQNESGEVALLFCGECFADPEIKSELRRKGHVFSDAGGAWLTHLYEDRGEEFCGELNGLFSGLLIDRRRHKVFLFNDRYGIERIYWHQTAEAFYFASEAKALLRILPALREFDSEGVAHFVAFGSTLAGRTLFRGVNLLPGGSRWTLADGKCVRETYFSLATWESQPALDAEAFQTQFSATFKEVLPRYFASESPIGLSLTAGLDTRMIMACRPATRQEPVCYTFDSARPRTLDARLASRIAHVCGLEHHVLRIGADFLSNFASHADRTIFISDGYFGATGAHELYLNRLARDVSPVRLGGAFGGEVLRGVSTFKPRRLAPQFVLPEFQKYAAGLAPTDFREAAHPVTFTAFKEIPWSIFGSPAICRSQLVFRTPYLDNDVVALAYQMPDALRRSPELALGVVGDHKAELLHVPTDMGFAGEASALRAAGRQLFSKVTFKLDYFYNEGLPGRLSFLDPLLNRSASALGLIGLHKYLHYAHWFRRELATQVRDMIAECARHESPFWDAGFLSNAAERHLTGHGNFVQEIDCALTLDAVERLLFRELPR